MVFYPRPMRDCFCLFGMTRSANQIRIQLLFKLGVEYHTWAAKCSICCQMHMYRGLLSTLSIHKLPSSRGTGIVSSSSTPPPPPHLKRVIGNLLRLLHDVLHDKEALVYSDYSRETSASSCQAMIFGRLPAVYPDTSAQQRCQCSSRISTLGLSLVT